MVSQRFEVSLRSKPEENENVYFLIFFLVTGFINITKAIKLTPRGRPDAAFEISLFSLMKYQIPIMISVGFGCTRLICCQGKEAKFQFREFPVLFFQRELWFAFPTHRSSCGSEGWVGKGLPFLVCWELEQEQAHCLA